MIIPTWVFIGLFAQLLWVIGAIVDKYLIEKYFSSEDEDESGVGTLILFSSVFSIGVSIVAAVVALDKISFGLTESIFGLILGFSNAIWVLFYLHAIEETELSRTIPIFQTIPIFGFIFGWLFLQETLTTQQVFASLVIISGAFLLSYHFSNKAFQFKPLLLMLAASAVVGFQETFFKVLAIDFSFWHSAFWLGLGFSLFGLLLFIFKKKYRQEFIGCLNKNSNTIWVANGLNELVDNTANLAFAFAVTLGPIALVQSVNAYQPLLMLIMSYAVFLTFGDFLDEDLEKQTIIQKIIGVLIITIGSVLFYFSL